MLGTDSLEGGLGASPGGQGHRACQDSVLKPLRLTGYLHQEFHSGKRVDKAVQS